jgi:hypothetical protein
MQSSRVRLMLVALLGVFAFCAVAAAAAEAEEAPFWTVPKAEGSKETKRLAGGETHYITAKSYNETTLTSEPLGITVKCEAVKLKESTPGVILGSNAGEPGTDSEVIEFEKNCRQTGNSTKPEECKVTEPILTTNVKSELVENTAKKQLLTEFFPEKGAKFTTVVFTGTCKTKEIAVEGSVAAEVRTDPNKPDTTEIGEIVELPNTHKVAESWLLNFPETPIKKVWLVKAGEGKEAAVELKAATEPAKFTGTVLVLLAKRENGKIVSEAANWSPLP